MAEVLSVVTSPGGFVYLLRQVIVGVDTLRDIRSRARKAPAELSSLTDELACLRLLLEEIKDKTVSGNDPLLQLCHDSCEQVVGGLEKLRRRLPAEQERSGKQKVLEIFAFRHWKEDVEALRQSIRESKTYLIMANTRHSTVRLEEIANQIHISLPPVTTPAGDVLITSSFPPTPASSSPEETVNNGDTIACDRPFRNRRRWNCAERHCSCSCHRTTRTNRRFWALEYTPLHIFRQACDNKSCNATEYGGTLSFALSQLGIPWSAIIQFHVLAEPGKFLFRPAFEMERIVRYTSPGFEALWRCQNNLITVEEARDRLTDLYRSDPTFKNHVNPSGKSYIEELLRAPWRGPVNVSKQYKLLELFMREFGMTRGTESTRFLACCADWIGGGPHLELLDVLLSFGFDPTLIDSPHVQDWPEPYTPNRIVKELAPDPFFVDYQSRLLRDNQGKLLRFAGMTPLHEAVLLGSSVSVKNWIRRSDKDERNFLGQTPIHFATSNSSHLLALANSGHDLDAADNYGITPIMYAAAANQEKSVIALLELGANPILQNTRYQPNFMRYACIRGHWNLILKALQFMQSTEEREVAERWARLATRLYHVVYPDSLGEREVTFQQLLAMCGSVNFIFNDPVRELENNSLLHYVRSVKDVEVLLELGFTRINHVNSAGQHALMSIIIKQCKPTVVSKLLDAGAKIDLKDNEHHATLYYVLDRLQFAHNNVLWDTMEILHILLAKGAEILCGDCCRCPCSSNGCPPSALLRHSVCGNWFCVYLPVWSMEWLSLVLEHRGIGDAKMILLSFIRKAKFEEMDVTHVCCSGNRARYRKQRMSDEDIDEILDEESEFAEILENEMAQCCDKEYEVLLDDWMLQMKALLEKIRVQAAESNKHLISKETSRRVFLAISHFL
ncbi:ankyrin [Hyaloscypha variabilis F]|uniref:Ankyrin n=1 Tax=Hyaloscypha variabilis (strain UAMH 11265 / GT02V1 / F) TaxID=1149755 RepID=A0A2J6RHD5_HYAVF|nr:ankyrin [Hyaloscypha variabilis F]